MAHLPKRRILTYLVLGTIVVAVGIWGLVSSGGEERDGSALVVEAAGADAGATSTSCSTTSTTLPEIFVQVAGAVNKPGVYRVPASSRVFQVLAVAGGVTGAADPAALLLASAVTDGGRIYVPKRGEVPAGAGAGGSPSMQATVPASIGSSGGAGPGSASAGGSSAGKVSLNQGTAQDLDSLPGIGPSLAGRIISYRQEHGPFRSVDQLDDVPGIGPATLERLRSLVCL